MNSRFKFRVWNTFKNKYSVEDWLPMIDEQGEVCLRNINDVVYYPPTDQFIIEQCTGLKDKNGKLIYEGDLLGGLSVVWVNDLNGFRVKVNTIHGWDWHYINEFTNQEITGNIHEQKDE